MPRVSVAIASYNHEKYVAEAIQSVLDQTYQDFEIVVTDDGSSDDTVREIKRLSDSRIKLFEFGANLGACVAINKSITESTGEYIAIFNSDDILLPCKLEKQVRYLDENPSIGAVFGQAEMVGENGQELSSNSRRYCTIFKQPNRTRFEWLKHFFYEGNCLCHPTLLIRRECYETVGLYDMRYAQLPDLDMWIRLCMEYDIHVMQENLIKFRLRRNAANASANKPDVLKRRYWELRHILDNYLAINSLELLHKIFPESKKYGEDFDAALIPFVLAKTALEIPEHRPIWQFFAIDTISNLLGNRQKAELLAQTFNFTYIDFIKVTGELDLFNIVKVKKLKRELKRSPMRKILSWVGK